MKSRNRITVLCLAGVVTASMLLARTGHSYDGDVDYSAPYVTLDPETGKLVTVDPKQEQAAAAQQTQHPAGQMDTSASTEAANGITSAIQTDSSQAPSTEASSSTMAVFTAVIAIVLIGVFVTLARRKSGTDTDKPGV